MDKPLTLALLVLVATQLVANLIFAAPGKTLVGPRPGPMDGNTSAETGHSSSDASPSTQGSSRHRGETMRTRQRHHRARQNGRRVKMTCLETPTATLVGRLGPAFNARYMSVDMPHDTLSSVSASLGESPIASTRRRHPADHPGAASSDAHGQFRVDGNYSRTFAKESQQTKLDRTKRASRKKAAWNRRRTAKMQWECEQEIVWSDLGADFFPRYLRSVICSQSVCWFGAFECRPRAFTVKVRKSASAKVLK